MNGITNLQTLIGLMSPELSDESFVFVSLEPDNVPKELRAEGTFREKEGITIICEESEALKYSFAYEVRYKRISLGVHSSLDAVGFLSAIASELTKAEISCNVISAYYHDHIFVPELAAVRALAVLKNLIENNPDKPRDQIASSGVAHD